MLVNYIALLPEVVLIIGMILSLGVRGLRRGNTPKTFLRWPNGRLS